MVCKMQSPLDSKNQQELFDALAQYEGDSSTQIRVVVAGSVEPLADIAQKRTPFPLRVTRIGDFAIGQFNYTSGDLRLAGTMFFCSTTHKTINYIISVCSGTVWHRSILRFVKALYPKLVPVFLTQGELLGLLNETKATIPETDFRIVGHSRKQSLRVSRRRLYETSRTRTDKTLEAVFAEADEQNCWFSSVSFEFEQSKRANRSKVVPLVSATLSKYGHFFCSSQFDHFLYGTLAKMTDIAERKMKFFSNRSRRDTHAFKVRPIAITYNSPEFGSQKESNNFVEVMRRMEGTSCSVLHNNPYVHLSVVDSTDGSAADVWVLKNDEILLVPQIKASEAALKKVVNYIFEEWREGSVSSPPSDGI
jgi:hypothetical protein